MLLAAATAKPVLPTRHALSTAVAAADTTDITTITIAELWPTYESDAPMPVSYDEETTSIKWTLDHTSSRPTWTGTPTTLKTMFPLFHGGHQPSHGRHDKLSEMQTPHYHRPEETQITRA